MGKWLKFNREFTSQAEGFTGDAMESSFDPSLVRNSLS